MTETKRRSDSEPFDIRCQRGSEHPVHSKVEATAACLA
jgi:hypothetical protein